MVSLDSWKSYAVRRLFSSLATLERILELIEQIVSALQSTYEDELHQALHVRKYNILWLGRSSTAYYVIQL